MPMKKLPQPKATVGLQQRACAGPDVKTKRPPSPKIICEPVSKKTAEIIKKVSDPAAGFVDGDRARLCSEEKMEAAKRKLRQGYQEAADAKRRRKTQLVQAPKMMQPASQVQPIRSCSSSMVKKTFALGSALFIRCPPANYLLSRKKTLPHEIIKHQGGNLGPDPVAGLVNLGHDELLKGLKLQEKKRRAIFMSDKSPVGYYDFWDKSACLLHY
ncbi:hypothetical protein TRIUR3_34283 [Triticum urartu]|uniref:Uncharacterized protein n=1 Tax=Triticum urartu TaxID=4572 RepID=M7YXJ0_TRIUA|nr:hypothetical protein TRIUR3_34283 [Triticum urartu]